MESLIILFIMMKVMENICMIKTTIKLIKYDEQDRNLIIYLVVIELEWVIMLTSIGVKMG